MRNSETPEPRPLIQQLKAASGAIRLKILHDLKRPRDNFPPQVDGDPVTDGVCADFIRERMGIAAATASRHLTLLTDAGFLIATRKKGWTFYRRDEAVIAGFIDRLGSEL